MNDGVPKVVVGGALVVGWYVGQGGPVKCVTLDRKVRQLASQRLQLRSALPVATVGELGPAGRPLGSMMQRPDSECNTRELQKPVYKSVCTGGLLAIVCSATAGMNIGHDVRCSAGGLCFTPALCLVKMVCSTVVCSALAAGRCSWSSGSAATWQVTLVQGSFAAQLPVRVRSSGNAHGPWQEGYPVRRLHGAGQDCSQLACELSGVQCQS